MAKQNGLGDQLYVEGFNLSGDIGSLGAIGGGNESLPDTGIDKSAMERLGGLRDGRIEFTAWFNPTAGAAHDRFGNLPTTDVALMYLRGSTLGGAGAGLIAKQLNYDPTRGDDGALTFEGETQGNGFALEWGEQLTAGIDTFTGAAAGTGLDYGAAVGSTDFGLQAYLQVFAFTGTSATVAIQDSNDNAVGDPYTNITAAVFAAASAVGAQRIQTSRTENVKRWLRINISGTFSALDLAVIVARNAVSTVF